MGNDNPNISFADNPEDINNVDFITITVPIMVTKSKDPDMPYIESAARTIGRNPKRGAIVVLESTVYPGVSEDVLKSIPGEESGLIYGTDFKIGYSSERINPGDDAHALAKITKIIAGMDAESADRLAGLYGLITSVYMAKDIKTGKAAKVIENVRRNFLRKNLVKPSEIPLRSSRIIVLVNELTLIFRRMGLPDVERFMAMGETPVLVDVRGMFDREEAERKGIYYRRL